MYDNYAGICYCQKDKEDKNFEKFCTIFLPDCPLKEIKDKNTIPDRLILVLNLPPVNRQDDFKVLYGFIKDINEELDIKSNYD